MKKSRALPKIGETFLLSHIFLAILIVTIFIPGERDVQAVAPMIAAISLVEFLFLFGFFRAGRPARNRGDLMVLIWGFLLLWEVMTTKLDKMHRVLFPLPENVFNVFATQYGVLIGNVLSSMQLLAIGFTSGIVCGLFLGLIVGWHPRLKDTFFPVAQVLTPITPIIYAPYLIAIMPTFRSASALVIFCGIFWPTFLNMIIRVQSIEPKILDSARALDVKGFAMLRFVLLPYVLPSVVSGLKVTLTTSMMMLTFAEMMGATSGMGYYIINYAHYANYTNVVAGIILVGFVVTILNRLVDAVQRRAIRWR